jgi:hypothetical protein
MIFPGKHAQLEQQRSAMRFHCFTILLGTVALVTAANTPSLRKVSQ